MPPCSGNKTACAIFKEGSQLRLEEEPRSCGAVVPQCAAFKVYRLIHKTTTPQLLEFMFGLGLTRVAQMPSSVYIWGKHRPLFICFLTLPKHLTPINHSSAERTPLSPRTPLQLVCLIKNLHTCHSVPALQWKLMYADGTVHCDSNCGQC